MKITQLTPGTGSFHCGSCLRDLTLVRALRGLGHDVALVPLYLPLVDDGIVHAVGDDLEHVRLGGISLYLREKSAVVRALPYWMTDWLDAPWMLRKASRRMGMTSPDELGEMTVSMVRGEHGRQVDEVKHLADVLKRGETPDVLSLSNVMLAGMAGVLKRELSVAVVCTLQGEDAFLDTLPEPWRGQAWLALVEACRDVDRFIAVSGYYAEVMTQRLQLDPSKVEVVHNGIDLTGYPLLDEPVAAPLKPTIGYLAHLRPEKGLHRLIDAFVSLKSRSEIQGLRLCVVGTTTPADARYIAEQKAKLTTAGVAEDVSFHTNVTREKKLELLREMSVLSVPAEYGESFGLYVLEANAMGVPAVQPDVGAFGEVLAATGGGAVCEAGDVDALASGLKRVLADSELRKELGATGRASVWRSFSADTMGRNVANVLERACQADLK